MKTANLLFKKSALVIITIFSLSPVTTYAQNNPSGSQPSKLVYNYPVNVPVRYRATTKVVMDMDINGQSTQTIVNAYTGLTLKSQGTAGNNFKIEVTIDTMAQSTDSPMGSNGGSIPDISGKAYNILISPDGKVTDNSEAKNVTYAAGAGGTSDAVQITENFFPVLPTVAIKPGYTWTTEDSINIINSSMTTLGTVKSENTFDGFELYNGINCARITSVLSGTRIMKTQNQGMDIKMSGPYTGSIVVFFAPSTGYFIKQNVSLKLTGTMDMNTPDAISFPLVMEITSTNEIIN